LPSGDSPLSLRDHLLLSGAPLLPLSDHLLLPKDHCLPSGDSPLASKNPLSNGAAGGACLERPTALIIPAEPRGSVYWCCSY
jgi:hypothetical protein